MNTKTEPITRSISVAKPGVPLLDVQDLRVRFMTDEGPLLAVQGATFSLAAGKSMAIVGESGSGKSTMARAIIDLLPGSGVISGGSIRYNGVPIVGLGQKRMHHVRGNQIGFVPQDPMQSLNPVLRVGRQVEEAIRANGLTSDRKEAWKLTVDALHQAGLPDPKRTADMFPHQLSGGMQQRVLIGIALSAQPGLLIADEPTSALDVTVQRVILDHLEERIRKLGTSLIFITHDLGLAAERAEFIMVMYRGRVVESGPSLEILKNPQHPYTQKLVKAAPSIYSTRLGKVDAVTRETSQVDLQTGRLATPPIIVKNLVKQYPIRSGSFRKTLFTAVDDVSLQVPKSLTTALVGESGSGKSTVAKMVLRLELPTSGTVEVAGKDVSKLKGAAVMELRRKVQPVFQNPNGALDPLRTVFNSIVEPLEVHNIGSHAQRKKRVMELLDQVALPRLVGNRYPSELSGGQRQRVAVARALAIEPEIMVLDEAVSALDVLVQAQVLDLLSELQQELGLTYLFITHDLGVVKLIADRVCVMERGRIVEQSTVDEVFENPKTEYTRRLLDAIPGSKLL